jgi:hypothetical protein
LEACRPSRRQGAAFEKADDTWGALESILGHELGHGEDDDPFYVRN